MKKDNNRDNIVAMNFNSNLEKLITDDSFYKASELVKEYKISHKNHKVISLGIGDVSLPVPKYVMRKMKKAVKNESSSKFVGYGNYYGIPELREAIRDNEYQDFSIEEIYVSQGTKSDCGDILELFEKDSLVGIVNPNYPIYENTCIALNKNYDYIYCDEDFVPEVPHKKFDVIYLCGPNNPVGINYTKEELKKWIDYANKYKAIIIYDNVYYKFITNGVKSIYDIKGARTCAIELRSFSKHLSFTGIRCSYYVIPNELHKDINKLWRLRTINRFNGASYIAQCGALASFNRSAKKQIDKNINYYKANAKYLLDSFKELGYLVRGGVDAPYMWVKCKDCLTSWETFNLFLNKLEIVVIPGIIFGNKGEGYFRVSALGNRKDIKEAIRRIRDYEQKIK